MACPTRPQPHKIMRPRMAPIRRSILRLPKVPSRYPSTRVSMPTPKVQAAVATPTRISTIVNTSAPEPNGRASPNPTVLTVMTLWNTASSTLRPKPA